MALLQGPWCCDGFVCVRACEHVNGLASSLCVFSWHDLEVVYNV